MTQEHSLGRQSDTFRRSNDIGNSRWIMNRNDIARELGISASRVSTLIDSGAITTKIEIVDPVAVQAAKPGKVGRPKRHAGLIRVEMFISPGSVPIENGALFDGLKKNIEAIPGWRVVEGSATLIV